MARTLAANSVSGWSEGWEEINHAALTAALSPLVSHAVETSRVDSTDVGNGRDK
jgi:hypothetical protein